MTNASRGISRALLSFGLGIGAVFAVGWTPTIERGALERRAAPAAESVRRYAETLYADYVLLESATAVDPCRNELGDVCGYVDLHRRLAP